MADARDEPDVWWQRAGELAPSITKDGLEPLFASMVHPPPTPASRTPWDWMFRVQIAAAFVLARSDDASTAGRGRLVDGDVGCCDAYAEARTREA